jgi:hypothetical protein
MKISTIFWLMLLAIVAMAGLAYVDEDREGAAALADFAQEQTTLAQSLAGALSAYLSAVRPDVLDGAQAQPELRSVLERVDVSSFCKRPAPRIFVPPTDDSSQRQQFSPPSIRGGPICVWPRARQAS